MPQSLSSILVHLVFSTKQREPLISGDLEPELHKYMATVLGLAVTNDSRAQGIALGYYISPLRGVMRNPITF